MSMHYCSRGVACSHFAACGGEKRRRSEDTSRSSKELRPLPGNPTALTKKMFDGDEGALRAPSSPSNMSFKNPE
jgi:hypothetical protein